MYVYIYVTIVCIYTKCRSGLNKGYAFVNFTEPRAVWKFYLASKDQSWDFFNSKKRREIVCARLQVLMMINSSNHYIFVYVPMLLINSYKICAYIYTHIYIDASI